MTFVWTDDRLQRAARMWKEGLTAEQIAAGIGGVSRNAVLGKVHRHPDLFAPRRDANSRKRSVVAKVPAPKPAPALKKADGPVEERQQQKVVRIPARLFGYPVPLSVPVRPSGNFRHRGLTIGDAASIAFKDRGAFRCAWPLTDFQDPSGPDMPCCGRPRQSGSYCAEHAAISRGAA